MDFRYKAQEHLKSAKAHFENQQFDAFPAACLELRMAIECVAYELLQSFKDDVDIESMSSWQPGKLIEELKEIDDHADKDSTIFVGAEDEYGVEPKVMHFLGESKRPSASWVKKNYAALGSFVHERTIAQLASEDSSGRRRGTNRFNSIVTELERILSSTLWGLNRRITISVRCVCGFHLTRRESLLKEDGRINCPSCGEILRGEYTEKGWRFFHHSEPVTCPYEGCGETNYLPLKDIHEGHSFQCSSCNKPIKLENRLTIVRAEFPAV